MKVILFFCLFAFLSAEDDATLENVKERVVANVVKIDWNNLKPKLSVSDKVDAFSACIIEDKDGSEHVYFKDDKKNIVYEITGFPLVKRYSSDLLFSEPGRLNFNRWHTPHFGWHYEIDCRLLKTIDVHDFADKFFIFGNEP